MWILVESEHVSVCGVRLYEEAFYGVHLYSSPPDVGIDLDAIGFDLLGSCAMIDGTKKWSQALVLYFDSTKRFYNLAARIYSRNVQFMWTR